MLHPDILPLITDRVAIRCANLDVYDWKIIHLVGPVLDLIVSHCDIPRTSDCDERVNGSSVFLGHDCFVADEHDVSQNSSIRIIAEWS